VTESFSKKGGEEMLRGKSRKLSVVLVILALWLFLPANQARAVPSFERQTGLDCTSCHTVFPELTPVGRNFKLNGYTASKHSNKSYEFPPPLAGMFQASFTHINRSVPPNIAQGFDPAGQSRANDNVSLPQQISAFYAGRIYGDHLGAFIQGTYDGVANKFFLDNTDVRLVTKTQLAGKDLVLGLTANNSPTVQDVLNTTPAWGFPWAASSVALTPGAGAVIDGGLAQQVGGIGAYFYWNNLVYGEFTVYRTARNGFTQFLGTGTVTDTPIQDIAPYWRVFLQHQWGKHALAVGTYGLVSRVIAGKPVDVPNLFDTRGPIDRFTDTAFDAQYQFLGKKHIFTVQSTFIHEDQRLNATYAQGGSDNNANWLDTFRINLNYYYRSPWGTMGGTAAYFSTWGSRDFGIYAPDPGDGSRTGKPNSDGFVLEADYLPWKYTKITIQYTLYNRFNGARFNYDGNPMDFPNRRNATDNNTLYILIWQMM
jgi:hypothetical protein